MTSALVFCALFVLGASAQQNEAVLSDTSALLQTSTGTSGPCVVGHGWFNHDAGCKTARDEDIQSPDPVTGWHPNKELRNQMGQNGCMPEGAVKEENAEECWEAIKDQQKHFDEETRKKIWEAFLKHEKAKAKTCTSIFNDATHHHFAQALKGETVSKVVLFCQTACGLGPECCLNMLNRKANFCWKSAAGTESCRLIEHDPAKNKDEYFVKDVPNDFFVMKTCPTAGAEAGTATDDWAYGEIKYKNDGAVVAIPERIIVHKKA